MRLIELEYYEHEDRPSEWRLQRLELQQLNLLVGKNASGKTRTLNIINGLAAKLSNGSGDALSDGSFFAEFDHRGVNWDYRLWVEDGKVTFERLHRGPQRLLHRTRGGGGEIWAEKEGRFIEFQTPTEKIAAVMRQDSVQHPYLEELLAWGERHITIRLVRTWGEQRSINLWHL